MSEFVERAEKQSTRISHEYLRDPDVSGRAAKIANYVLSFEAHSKINISAISRALSVNRRTVTEAFDDLRELGYLRDGILADTRNRAESAQDGLDSAHYLHSEQNLHSSDCADSAQCAESAQKPAETVQKVHRADPPAAPAPVLAPARREAPVLSTFIEENTPTPVDDQDVPKEKDFAVPAAEPDPPAKPVKKARRKYDYSDDFKIVWAVYPKGSKANAFREWQAAIERADPETIMAAIEPYLVSKPDKTFRKDLERWLSGDMWEAEVIKPKDPLRAESELRYQGGKDAHADKIAKLTPEERKRWGIK